MCVQGSEGDRKTDRRVLQGHETHVQSLDSFTHILYSHLSRTNVCILCATGTLVPTGNWLPLSSDRQDVGFTFIIRRL